MSHPRRHHLHFRLATCLGTLLLAIVPVEIASAVYVDFTPPAFTAPTSASFAAATLLPNPALNYEQPAYVFNLASKVGEDGIFPGVGTTIDVTDDSGNTNWAPTGQMGPFAPGSHTVTWKAADLALNSVTGTQTVTVKPHVNLVVDQTIGGSGTINVTVQALLNGPAPLAVGVPLSITSNTSAPNTAASCTGNPAFTIAIGQTSNSCTFTIGPNATAGNIVFSMGAPTNAFAGSKNTHTVTVTTSNLPPAAELSASQAGVTHTVVTTAGNVTITPSVRDPNVGDTFSYDWSGSDASLMSAATNGTTNSAFIFNPVSLAPGFYTARLTVTDNHGASSRRDLTLSVIAAAPTLSTTTDTDDDNAVDSADGYRDTDNDGIPDYLDAISASNLLQGVDIMTYVSELTDSRNNISGTFNINWTITTASSNKVFYPLLLRTTPGLTLQLGPLAIRQGVHQARMSATSAVSALGVDPGTGLISADGSVLDVEISGLSPGATAQLVVPQPAPIPTATGTPATTTFRLFTASNTWNDFSVTGNDTLKSATKNSTYFCPPPAHADYVTAGITAGKECVQLTITDGGPNDSDGIVNGSVRVLGSVFISSSDTTTTYDLITTPGDTSASNIQHYKNNAGEGGGGIGALWWEILFLAPLLRRRKF